jgi:hypothetical protein
VGDADQMLVALNECVASLRSYGEEVGKMSPIQVMSHNPKDHRS